MWGPAGVSHATVQKWNGIITDVRQKYVKERHWARISRVLGLHTIAGVLTLGAVWGSGLGTHENEVMHIVKAAQGETVIEQVRAVLVAGIGPCVMLLGRCWVRLRHSGKSALWTWSSIKTSAALYATSKSCLNLWTSTFPALVRMRGLFCFLPSLICMYGAVRQGQ